MVHVVRKIVHLIRRAQVAGLGSEPSWRRVGPGIEMQIDPQDWMDRAFFLGTYDPWLLAVIRRWIRPGDQAVDVGAHKGYASLHLARQVESHGRVFAFEPDPRARACLERHRDRNRMSQLVILPFALGRSDGEQVLALSRKLGWSSFFPNEEARAAIADTMRVSVRSFDAWVSKEAIETDRIRFVKIDAEGAEPLVIEGMRETLTRLHPMLWIEINRGSLAAGRFDAGGIQRDLETLGYALFRPRGKRGLGGTRTWLEQIDSLESHEDVFDVVAVERGTEPR